MAVIRGYTAERMKEIEDSTVVHGEVNSGGDLILETRAGTEINAGHVKGADATALLTIEDTSTLDLTLTGAGTPASPWLLKGVTKSADLPTLASNIDLNDLLTPGKWSIDDLPLASVTKNWPGCGVPNAYTADAYNGAGSFIACNVGTIEVWTTPTRAIQEATLLVNTAELKDVIVLRRFLSTDGVTWTTWKLEKTQWASAGPNGQKLAAQFGGANLDNVIDVSRVDSRPAFTVKCTDPAGVTWFSAQDRIYQWSPAWLSSAFSAPWVHYNTPPGPPNYYGQNYIRTSAGIVVLRGLVKSGAANSTIFTLPGGFRPAAQSIFLGCDTAGSGGSYIAILPSGEVQWRGNVSNNSGWVNLDGVAFPAADVAPNSAWTNYVLNTSDGWSVYDPLGDTPDPPASAFPRPAWWQDKYGRVWSRGLAKRASQPAANSTIATFPMSLVPNAQIHQAVYASGTSRYASIHYGETVGTNPRNGIVWKAESPVGSTGFVNFGDIKMFPVANFPESVWVNMVITSGGNYGNGFPPASLVRMGDGLIHVRGLVSGSFISAVMGNNDKSSGGGSIFATSSNSSLSRINLTGNSFGKASGNTVWTSLDGILFVVEG